VIQVARDQPAAAALSRKLRKAIGEDAEEDTPTRSN
jgi:hypothetical protein